MCVCLCVCVCVEAHARSFSIFRTPFSSHVILPYCLLKPWHTSVLAFLPRHTSVLSSLSLTYCKSRIFRTHSIFVSWALRPFVRMKFSYGRWPPQILWHALYLPNAFYFRTEDAAYEIYENNMHTKYSGFTVLSFCKLDQRRFLVPVLISRAYFHTLSEGHVVQPYGRPQCLK